MNEVFEATPLNSFLYYIIDGLIPLITTFCTQLASHISSGLTSKLQSRLLTDDVKSGLNSFSDSIAVSFIHSTWNNIIVSGFNWKSSNSVCY